MNAFTDPYEYAKGSYEAEHTLWTEFLEVLDVIFGRESKVFETLYSFRVLGLELSRGKRMYVLKPIIDENVGSRSAWGDMAAYEKMRTKYLVPLTAEIKAALQALTRYCRWKRLLTPLIERQIVTPLGRGILQGMSPYGVRVDVSGEEKTFKFAEVEPF